VQAYVDLLLNVNDACTLTQRAMTPFRKTLAALTDSSTVQRNRWQQCRLWSSTLRRAQTNVVLHLISMHKKLYT